MTGAIVLATHQGLGYLAKDFYDNGLIDKVMIRQHTSRTNHPKWYDDWRWMDSGNYEWFFKKLKTILLFEEVWDWSIILEARKRGIKTVLMPMYECTRNPLPYFPDVIISPSLLDQKYYPQSDFVPVPVKEKWKLRETAEVFVHNAGNGGLGGRNGTAELIKAMEYVQSPIKLIIRTQAYNFKCDDPRVEIRRGVFKKEELYREGDVFIFPEKFNGLSLPLQEAFASGMLVMCGDRFPVNTWLPTEPLIPISGYRQDRIAVDFESAIICPTDIAETIDRWYGKDISEFSKQGKQYAIQNSWSKLKKVYAKYL